MVLAESLSAHGVIQAGELVDLYEQADAAYAWGVEEQISSCIGISKFLYIKMQPKNAPARAHPYAANVGNTRFHE